MLILRSLSLEPLYGFGVAKRIEQVSRGVFKVNPGSLLVAFRRSNTGLFSFVGNRQQKAAWVGDLERSSLPLRVVRVGIELDAGALGPRRDLVDVLRRRDEHAHAHTLLPVAAFLP